MLPLTKRQREIFDYLNEFIQKHGTRRVSKKSASASAFLSLATVHKHLTNLQEKVIAGGNRSRSVGWRPRGGGRAIEPFCSVTRRRWPSDRGRRPNEHHCRRKFAGKRDTHAIASAATR